MNKHIRFAVVALWGFCVTTVSHSKAYSKEAMTMNSVQLIESVLFATSDPFGPDCPMGFLSIFLRPDCPMYAYF